MPPIPCAHCGFNYMRHDLNPELPRLCNNCILKENIRNPPKMNELNYVTILIKCPMEQHVKIEEYCINKGVDLSTYFMELYNRCNGVTCGSDEGNPVSSDSTASQTIKKGAKK